MQRRGLHTAATVLALGAGGCGDDTTSRDSIGPVPVADAGPAPDAPPESGPAPPPDQLSPESCGALEEMPGAQDPLDTLTALAVTDTRIYAASSTAVLSFDRDGDCAGSLTASFQGGSIVADEPPLDLAARDDVGLVVADGRGATLKSDDPFFSKCLSLSAVRSLALPADGTTAFGAFVSPAVRRLALAADGGCESSTAMLPGDVVSVLSIGPTLSADSMVAATRDPAGAIHIGRYSIGANGDAEAMATVATSACSARAVVRVGATTALLDASCGRVRVVDDAGAEIAEVEIPEGTLGRALALVPGTSRLLLATVSGAGAAPELAVIDLE